MDWPLFATKTERSDTTEASYPKHTALLLYSAVRIADFSTGDEEVSACPSGRAHALLAFFSVWRYGSAIAEFGLLDAGPRPRISAQYLPNLTQRLVVEAS